MSRQPNRRPRIYKGGDGLWHCYVTLGTKPNGQLDRRHRQGRTAAEVAAKVEQLLEQTKRGGGVPQKIETVEQWLLYWVENVIRPTRAWGTYTAYRALIANHVIPHIGAWRLDGHRRRLEPEHLEAMYEAMRHTRIVRGGGTMSASTVQKTHRMLRKAFKDAVRRGKASRNVCDLVDAPQARRGRVDAHTLDEAQAIIRTAMDDPMAARWLLGMLLGPRQGETLGLRWHRVHLDPLSGAPRVELETQLQRRTWQHGCADPAACTTGRHRTGPCPPSWQHGCADPAACKARPHLCPKRRPKPGCRLHKRACPPPCPPGCTGHARHCPKRTGGGIVEVELKTEKSVRDLVLPPVLVDLLRQHRQRQQELYATLGLTWSPDGLVFATEWGRPLDAARDHKAWESLLRRAGVADSRLHAARHTAGTMMVASGTDSRVVQEILGHTQITTTQGYVDVAQNVKAQAVDRAVAALMNGDLAALLQRGGATGAPSA